MIAGVPVRARAFLHDESGAGTIFALFFVAVIVLLAGVAIDSTNAWRNREIMKVAADVSAHAGAVALARGATGPEAAAIARRALALNYDQERSGPLFADPRRAVFAFHYDPDTNRAMPGGPYNAVAVRVERSFRNGNPVPTMLIDVAGKRGWDITAESYAAIVPTERCNPGSGLYARGRISVAGVSGASAGTCLHSQSGVNFAGTPRFEAGSILSMPDQEGCTGLCDEMVAPGISAARIEMNLVMTPPGELIADLTKSLLDPKRASVVESSFFRGKSVPDDLSALEELSIPTEKLGLGSVIELTPLDFSRIRELPAGLVYHVTCAAPENSEVYGDSDLVVLLSGGSMPRLHDAALVTDCPVVFGRDADLSGALVVALGGGSGVAHGPGSDGLPQIGADPEAVIGSAADNACDASLTSTILVRGDTKLRWSLFGNNVRLVVDGNLSLLSSPGDGETVHRGVGIHAGGTMDFESGFRIAACPRDGGTPVAGASAATPELRVIRHIVPDWGPVPPNVPQLTTPKTIVVASQS